METKKARLHADYIAAAARAFAALEAVRERIEGHPAPEGDVDPTWGDVAELHRIAAHLEALYDN